jgi:hypothetical protein
MGIYSNDELWDRNIITVSFLRVTSGSDERFDTYLKIIKNAAKKWEQYCDIEFKFLDYDNYEADVRIKMDYGGYFHTIGIGKSLLINNKGQYNMALGHINTINEQDNYFITFLFGLVLGLIPEHYHPNSQWKYDVIPNYDPNMLECLKNKYIEDMERYVYTKFNCRYSSTFIEKTYFSEVKESYIIDIYDKKSIMHFDLSLEENQNKEISEGDIRTVSKMYPKNKN